MIRKYAQFIQTVSPNVFMYEFGVNFHEEASRHSPNMGKSKTAPFLKTCIIFSVRWNLVCGKRLPCELQWPCVDLVTERWNGGE